MSNKTCGECKHYKERFKFCRDVLYPLQRNSKACVNFEKEIITNGEKIIAGGMRAVAEFALHHCCNNCIYFDGNNPYRSTCGKPDNKTCIDGLEAWLNAPAESEKINE